MQHLEDRKQDLKYQLYRGFTNTLLVSVVAGLLFGLYQAGFVLTNQHALHWSYLWIIDGGFAFVLYSGILVAIAVLFRPSNMASRYAYAPVGVTDDEDDEESMELTAANNNGGDAARAGTDSYADDEADVRRFQKEQAAKEKQ